jgi:hypothetical protein
LRSYSATTIAEQGSDVKEPGTLTNMRELVQDEDTWMGSLFDFIKGLGAARDVSYEDDSPPEHRRLLTALSHQSPVSGFLLNGRDIAPVLEAMAEGQSVAASPRNLSLLLDSCPCLVELLHSGLCQDGTLPSGLRDTVRHMAAMVNKFTDGVPYPRQ